jgi:NADPH-dependent curcumin reductase CurA
MRLSIKERTVVVSGATGETDVLVMQIARKIIGWKTVIGMTGFGREVQIRWEPRRWPMSELQEQELQEGYTRPEVRQGVFWQCSWEDLDFMLKKTGQGNVIAACGAIGAYNTATERTIGPKN